MDPWLERHWGDLHHRIVQYGCDLIAEQLPDTLFARVEETVYLLASERDVGRTKPDVAVYESGSWAPGAGGSGIASVAVAVAVADPVRLRLQPVVEGHIEIRKLEGDQPLVTAIEVISRTNKLDVRNRRRYLQKGDAYYAGGANVVEIDLLRAGEPLIDVPWDQLAPEQHAPYKACVRRVPPADADGEVEYYPLPLRQRLPRIRIPLQPADPDVILDLQQPIDRAYALGRYGAQLDYAAPPPPPLSPDDTAWATERVRAWRAGA